jgi:ketosteroid isomerase-like protein
LIVVFFARKEAKNMSEQKIESVIRALGAALETKDVEKVLSLVADDAVWMNDEATFKGKEEWKRYLTWLKRQAAEAKFKDTGIGVMVKGNKAPDGMNFEVPGVCLYEFKNEKIFQHTTISDRLTLIKQVAKGAVQKRIVNSVVNAAEKGLH